MRILKLICLTVFQLGKQVWFLPQTVLVAVRQRRDASSRNEHEAERLDRIRNPDRYRGKY